MFHHIGDVQAINVQYVDRTCELLHGLIEVGSEIACKPRIFPIDSLLNF